ncbi:MAG: helix-turn-helix transcriptional regulator [Dermatophilaceae bacterium]|nr:AsnC family transcriptional regulator [Intrasporangiaceae bacterium]
MSRNVWTFLTNHGHVLVCLAADQEMLLRDVAASVGITERAVQQIVGDLEVAGIIARTRVGRRNHYLVRREERFRHPLESGVTVGEFVDLVGQASRSSASPEGEAVGEKTSLGPALHLVDDIQPLTASHQSK